MMTMLAVVVSVFLVGQAQTRPKPAALVVDRRGEVVIRSVAGETRPAAIGSRLYPGDRLTVPADGSATLAIRDAGVKERIRPGTEVAVGPLGCSPAQAVLRRTEQLPPVAAALKELPPASGDGRDAVGHFRGDAEDLPDPPPAVSPTHGATVASDRPALAWRSVEEAGRYRVRLISGTGRLLWQAETEGTRLAYPEGQPALRPGYPYRWEVADEAGRVLTRAEFTVATRSEAERIAELGPLAQGDDAADVLGAALGYARLHAWDEALSAFERLDRLRPGEPAVLKALDELRRRAGRQGDAGTVAPRTTRADSP